MFNQPFTEPEQSMKFPLQKSGLTIRSYLTMHENKKEQKPVEI